MEKRFFRKGVDGLNSSLIGKRVQRRVLAPPPVSSLSKELNVAMEKRSEPSYLNYLDGRVLSSLSSTAFLALRDPLSGAFQVLHGTPKRRKEHNAERKLTSVLRSHLNNKNIPENVTEFKNCLHAVASMTIADDNPWREGPIFLRPGLTGILVEFLDTGQIEPALEQALRIYHGVECGFYRSVYLYASVLNAHPMKDGNGRLSRTLINYCLQQIGLPETSYIPISEAMHRSSGGYHIALRRAEIHNQWESLFWFFIRVMDMCVPAKVE